MFFTYLKGKKESYILKTRRRHKFAITVNDLIFARSTFEEYFQNILFAIRSGLCNRNYGVKFIRGINFLRWLSIEKFEKIKSFKVNNHNASVHM